MGTPQLSDALLFLDAFGNGDFPSLSSGSEYAISSSAFLSSNVPDSELQASVFHTLDVGTGGWGDCRCCVQRLGFEVRGLPHRQDPPSRTSFPTPLPDVPTVEHGELWIPRRLILGGVLNPPHELGETRQWCLRETRQLCLRHAGRTRQVGHRVCVQRVLVYSGKVAIFNDPFWFQILMAPFQR